MVHGVAGMIRDDQVLPPVIVFHFVAVMYLFVWAQGAAKFPRRDEAVLVHIPPTVSIRVTRYP